MGKFFDPSANDVKRMVEVFLVALFEVANRTCSISGRVELAFSPRQEASTGLAASHICKSAAQDFRFNNRAAPCPGPEGPAVAGTPYRDKFLHHPAHGRCVPRIGAQAVAGRQREPQRRRQFYHPRQQRLGARTAFNAWIAISTMSR